MHKPCKILSISSVVRRSSGSCNNLFFIIVSYSRLGAWLCASLVLLKNRYQTHDDYTVLFYLQQIQVWWVWHQAVEWSRDLPEITRKQTENYLHRKPIRHDVATIYICSINTHHSHKHTMSSNEQNTLSNSLIISALLTFSN